MANTRWVEGVAWLHHAAFISRERTISHRGDVRDEGSQWVEGQGRQAAKKVMFPVSRHVLERSREETRVFRFWEEWKRVGGSTLNRT